MSKEGLNSILDDLFTGKKEESKTEPEAAPEEKKDETSAAEPETKPEAKSEEEMTDEELALSVSVDLPEPEEEKAKPEAEEKPETVTVLAGDANADGTIDVGDAVLLSRYCAEDSGITLTADGKLNADANGDGSITLDDVNEILRIVAKF